MSKNIGPLDRLVRMLLGNTLIFLSLFRVVEGDALTIVAVMGIAALLTSFFSFCPVYALLGISTVRK
jgi:hypothetical protein